MAKLVRVPVGACVQPTGDDDALLIDSSSASDPETQGAVTRRSRWRAGLTVASLALGCVGVAALTAASDSSSQSRSSAGSLIALVDADVEEQEEETACGMASAGEPCYDSVVWAMLHGVKEHPEWYPNLTQKSTFAEFQRQLAYAPKDTKCGQRPCVEPENCQTADPESECGASVKWDMSEGIRSHPEWYAGLTSTASYEDFQNHIYGWNKTMCPQPACNAQPFVLQTLFCWMVIMPEGYELELAKAQLDKKAGIFACDGYAIVSSQKLDIALETLLIPSTEVSGYSGDGTSPNAPIFVEAWRAIQADGKYADHKWIIKCDPDNVLLPDRLRMHLLPGMQPENPYPTPYTPDPSVGQFVANCDKMAGWGKGWGEGWPMMYGSLEIISVEALNLYLANEDACKGSIPWQGMGEDAFMGMCLRQLQVGELFMKQADNTCGGGSCDDQSFSSYHPYKDAGSWFDCWGRAQR